MINYYEILGLTENATLADINRQYKSLARTLHPDKGGSSHLFKQIQTAYDILSDKENISDGEDADFFAAPLFRGLREFFHGKPDNEPICQNEPAGLIVDKD